MSSGYLEPVVSLDERGNWLESCFGNFLVDENVEKLYVLIGGCYWVINI